MSKADISTTPIRSRRAVLAGIAAAAVIPAAAMSAAAPDPIFAALETFRPADAEFYAECIGDIPDEVGERWSNAVDAVVRTQPTTPAGLGALTGFAHEMAERTARGDDVFADREWIPVVAAINNATRGMAGLKAWAPPAQVVAPTETKAIDPVFEIIEKHRAAELAWKEAVHVEYAYENRDEVREMKPRASKAYVRRFQQLQDATSDAADRMYDLVHDLVTVPPATLAGIVALCTYLEPMFNDIDKSSLPDYVPVNEDDVAPQGLFAKVIAQSIRTISHTRASRRSRSDARSARSI
jgi:hypothetical protein